MTGYLKFYDEKIKSTNYCFQLTIGEYCEIIKESLDTNEFQRKRVPNSNSIYAQLKEDLICGCVMPPIVLSIESKIEESNDLITQLRELKPMILDGLQRTLTILDIIKNAETQEIKEKIKNNLIRIELYDQLSKAGLLYRMMTLNTGQTKMTTRHQIEIIYSNLLTSFDVPDIKLIRQVDDEVPKELGEYNFKDVVDGFTSYIQMNYLPIDRMDILDRVKDIERLSSIEPDSDLFADFIRVYHEFVKFVDANIDENFKEGALKLDIKKAPFGITASQIFKKSQPLTGFGNSIANLIYLNRLENISQVST